MYRIVRAARETEILKVLYHPGNVMEIRFKKPSMSYKAGQWLFLNAPEVSGWQWHPVYSLTLSPFRIPSSGRSSANFIVYNLLRS